MSEYKPEYVAAVVAAHISQHPALMSLTELHDTIMAVRRAFEAEITPAESKPETTKKTHREIKASIRPDRLISFEDGKPYVSLKRHLTRHGLTPEKYREKHGLHEDYPMVAPEYSQKRSLLAKKMGLGTTQR